MNETHRRFVRDKAGQVLVEFALASLVFFMTIFGTLEFGVAVWQYNMVSDLAQEGARWASVRGTTSSLPSSPAAASDVLTYLQGRSVGILGAACPPSCVTTTPGTVGAPGSTFSVTVTQDFAPLTALIPLTTLHLQSTAQMIVAR